MRTDRPPVVSGKNWRIWKVARLSENFAYGIPIGKSGPYFRGRPVDPTLIIPQKADFVNRYFAQKKESFLTLLYNSIRFVNYTKLFPAVISLAQFGKFCTISSSSAKSFVIITVTMRTFNFDCHFNPSSNRSCNPHSSYSRLLCR